MDKCVEKDSNANRTSEQFDQSCRSEKSEEADFNDPCGVDDASRHRYEVETVPTVFEVRLQQKIHEDFSCEYEQNMGQKRVCEAGT